MAHINDDAIDEIKELEDSFEKILERMNSSIIQEKRHMHLLCRLK